MSIIHCQRIKSHITEVFSGKVDLGDVANHKDKEKLLLTRALAAYAIHVLSGADVDTAADSVTDGSDDNGIDAVHYDPESQTLFLCQSKWIERGRGEPDVGEIQKFLTGVTDLLNGEYDKFNEKIRAKSDFVTAAVDDYRNKICIILVYPSVDGLARHGDRLVNEFTSELNDVSEVAKFRLLKQGDLHESLLENVGGEPIDLDITLKEWGRASEPFDAYYGQVSGEDVAKWWRIHGARLFSKNIRSMLGDSDINLGIRATIANEPEHFWFYNNGITIVAKGVTKNLKNGSRKDLGNFHCEDISIVNGAQTVSSIGGYSEELSAGLDNVFVQVRVISVQSAPSNFETDVTHNNNRQNRIENRDFVSLDPFQTRLQAELGFECINYQVKRSEGFEPSDDSFDIEEATIALACASGRGDLVVQLKREIGVLWENISRPPYQALFNSSVDAVYLWRCVKVQRKINDVIVNLRKSVLSQGKHESVLIHGNRIIATLVFQRYDLASLKGGNDEFEGKFNNFDFEACGLLFYERLHKTINVHYPSSVIATLFKNKGKCETLLMACKEDNVDDPSHPQLTFQF